MTENIDIEILTRYLDGSCSEEELSRVNEWAGISEENSSELALMKKIWQAPEKETPPVDTEKALESVLEKIHKTEKAVNVFRTGISTPGSAYEKQNIPFAWIHSPWLRAAAVITLMILSAIYIFMPVDSLETTVVSAGYGEIKEYLLPDGSEITLDSGTEISFNSAFGKENRNVELKGEAFFNVIHNEKSPFIVHAGPSSVKVLGTSFNVNAWEGKKNVEVVVERGRVAFTAIDKTVTINNGEMSRLNDLGFPSQPKPTDIKAKTSWLSRNMEFSGAPVDEVLFLLERWYNVKFETPDDFPAQKKVTIFIENKPLDEILDILALIIDYKWERKGDVISFAK